MQTSSSQRKKKKTRASKQSPYRTHGNRRLRAGCSDLPAHESQGRCHLCSPPEFSSPVKQMMKTKCASTLRKPASPGCLSSEQALLNEVREFSSDRLVSISQALHCREGAWKEAIYSRRGSGVIQSCARGALVAPPSDSISD